MSDRSIQERAGPGPLMLQGEYGNVRFRTSVVTPTN